MISYLVSQILNKTDCHPERRLARLLRQSQSKDLRLLLFLLLDPETMRSLICSANLRPTTLQISA